MLIASSDALAARVARETQHCATSRGPELSERTESNTWIHDFA